tara:strand:- start:1117 stop:1464 length:348 start_codon:yes stop_codon:yes gene_type:complete
MQTQKSLSAFAERLFAIVSETVASCVVATIFISGNCQMNISVRKFSVNSFYWEIPLASLSVRNSAVKHGVVNLFADDFIFCQRIESVVEAFVKGSHIVWVLCVCVLSVNRFDTTE